MQILTDKRIKIPGLVAVLGLLAAVAPGLRADEITIIANPSVKASAISSNDAKDVFLGESDTVGGAKVSPVLMDKGPTEEAFLKWLGKSESVLGGNWRKAVFTGKSVMPRRFDSDEAVISYVSSTPGTIGYVTAGKAAAGVKVLKVQ